MAEEGTRSVKRSTGAKPSVPPKPKSLCKPSPPPKPPNIQRLVGNKRQISSGSHQISSNSTYPVSSTNRHPISSSNSQDEVTEEKNLARIGRIPSNDSAYSSSSGSSVKSNDNLCQNDIISFKSARAAFMAATVRNSDSTDNANGNSDIGLNMPIECSRFGSNNIPVCEKTQMKLCQNINLSVKGPARMPFYGASQCNGYSSSDTSPTSSMYSDDQQETMDDDVDVLEKLNDVEICSSSDDKSSSSSIFPLSENRVEDSINNFSNSTPCDTSSLSNTCDLSTNNTSTFINNNSIKKKKCKVYNIAKEVMTSEKVFCDVLKLLNVEFRQYVRDQGCIVTSSINGGTTASFNRSNQHLSEDELDRILNYLPQLQNFSEGFLADLEERLADWDHYPKLADIIVTKGPFLKMYSCYIRDFEHQCNLLDEACSKYPSFAKAVQTFEASDICCKLGLKHYMLKPVQRIPQYRLLLQSYLERLPQTSADIDDARKALKILEEVANHANDTIKIEVSNSFYTADLLDLSVRLNIRGLNNDLQNTVSYVRDI